MDRDPLTLDALLALSAMDDLPRTGWIQRGVRDPETVGEHVLGLQWLCLALAPRCGVDPARAAALALVHDAPEALLGDWPRSAAELLPAGAKRAAEDAAAARLLAPLGSAAEGLWSEWREQRTDAARFVKACDRLQLGVRLLRQLRAGQRGLDEFLDTVRAADLGGFAALERLRAMIVEECARAR